MSSPHEQGPPDEDPTPRTDEAAPEPHPASGEISGSSPSEDDAPAEVPTDGDALWSEYRGVILVLLGMGIMFVAMLIAGIFSSSAHDNSSPRSAYPSERTCQRIVLHQGHTMSRADCAAYLNQMQERIDGAHEGRDTHRHFHERSHSHRAAPYGAPGEKRERGDTSQDESAPSGAYQPQTPSEGDAHDSQRNRAESNTGRNGPPAGPAR